jgi:septal ring factor EnvC (AmiA/AmiB activator)
MKSIVVRCLVPIVLCSAIGQLCYCSEFVSIGDVDKKIIKIESEIKQKCKEVRKLQEKNKKLTKKRVKCWEEKEKLLIKGFDPNDKKCKDLKKKLIKLNKKIFNLQTVEREIYSRESELVNKLFEQQKKFTYLHEALDPNERENGIPKKDGFESKNKKFWELFANYPVRYTPS